MINKIGTLRETAKNLTSHLIMEGKTKIKKPNAIIPGAVAATGVVMTLETKDNNAILSVQKDNKEIQKATFDYKETPDGYELVSAMSAYFYDDKEKKEVQQIHYLVEPELEKSFEHSINYAEAPIKKTTKDNIKKINASVAQVSGYKSVKSDYDPQESHTYGKKSLKRDVPALLKLLDVIAPKAEFTLKLKDKLKKDNKTSLIAFEASDTKDGNAIVKGFMSANGDSVSYRINTDDMIIIGEQSSDKDLSRAYLKPQGNAVEQNEKAETSENEAKKEVNNETTASIENESTAQTTQAAKTGEEENVSDTTNESADIKQEVPKDISRTNRIYPAEHYKNLIIEAATNKKLPTRAKAENYKNTLALAYLDGYDESELEKILLADGACEFSYYCRKTYVTSAIVLAKKGSIQLPVKTLNDKVKELKSIKIETEDEDLKICILNMIKEITKIKDEKIKEIHTDRALNSLKNNSQENFQPDLLLFAQEFSNINDDLKLHYEIYIEAVNNVKVNELKFQIKRMIDNIPNTNHEKRNIFLTRLYTNELSELKQLQKEIQELLNDNHIQQNVISPHQSNGTQKLLLEDLSRNNKKLVKRMLNARSPREVSLSFNEARNLLLDMGFVEMNVSGSHYKFLPPRDIYFNGEKQPFFTLTYANSKSFKAATVDDIINVCKQYYETKQ